MSRKPNQPAEGYQSPELEVESVDIDSYLATVKIIRPYLREPGNPNTLDGSLYRQGYSLIPGTGRRFYPRTDSRGVIRTGLNPDSIKIENIKDPQVKAQEKKRIQALKAHYEFMLGESLEPNSTFYDQIKENGHTLEDKDNIFNMNNPLQAVNFFWLLETEQVAPSKDALESGEFNSNQVKFYVHDSNIENKLAFERKKKINSAIAALDGMSELKRRKVQIMLGLGIPNTATDEEVYNAIDEYLRTPASTMQTDPIASFIRVTSYSDTILNVKVLIKDLVSYNIVRIQGTIVSEGDHVWAKSIEEFELFLADPVNSEILKSFKQKLKDKVNLSGS